MWVPSLLRPALRPVHEDRSSPHCPAHRQPFCEPAPAATAAPAALHRRTRCTRRTRRTRRTRPPPRRTPAPAAPRCCAPPARHRALRQRFPLCTRIATPPHCPAHRQPLARPHLLHPWRLRQRSELPVHEDRYPPHCPAHHRQPFANPALTAPAAAPAAAAQRSALPPVREDRCPAAVPCAASAFSDPPLPAAPAAPLLPALAVAPCAADRGAIDAIARCFSPHPGGFVDPRAAASVSGAVACISTPGTRSFASSWLPGYFAVIVAASPTVPV